MCYRKSALSSSPIVEAAMLQAFVESDVPEPDEIVGAFRTLVSAALSPRHIAA